LNEALAGRSRFVIGANGAVRPYVFVSAGRVKNSANTILATELWGTQASNVGKNQLGGSNSISNSRRSVSTFSYSLTGNGVTSADKVYLLPYTASSVALAPISKLSNDPEVSLPAGGGVPNPDTTLDFVGRNHFARKLGPIAGDTRSWDLRKSNFLYLDGHVETKHITETLSPTNQWGDRFYSLDQEPAIN
jgi:prepilin-type processing-associated H-X9-DG protein